MKKIISYVSLYILERKQLINISASDVEIGRSVACDGRFLFITGPTGRGLQKIGTGLHGTLRQAAHCNQHIIECQLFSN